MSEQRGCGKLRDTPPRRSSLALSGVSGRPVLFLHGLGASAPYWHPLRELAGDYSGTAPDLLGFGRSPKPG